MMTNKEQQVQIAVNNHKDGQEEEQKQNKIRSVQFSVENRLDPEADDDLTISQVDDDDDDDDDTDFLGSHHNDSYMSRSNNVSIQTFFSTNHVRKILIFLYTAATVGFPILIYVLMSLAEVRKFEVDFDSLSTRVVSGFEVKLGSIMNAIDSMSVTATSHAIDTNSTWPFVTLRDFNLVGGSALSLSETLVVSLNNLVTDESRVAWENYTEENIDWLWEGLEREEFIREANDVDSSRYLQENRQKSSLLDKETLHSSFQRVTRLLKDDPNEVSTKTFSKQIFRFDNTSQSNIVAIEESVGPYFPSWQSMPLDSASVNYNLLSYEPDRNAIIEMMETKRTVISKANYIDYDEANHHLTIAEVYSNGIFQASTKKSTKSYLKRVEDIRERPISNMYYPVYDSFADASMRTVVAMYSITILWETTLNGILPESSGGIICVIQNECGDVFTYEINGAETTFLGPNDLHDIKFESSAVHYEFSSINESDSFHVNSLTTPLTEQFCSYSLRIYPSRNLWYANITFLPLIIAGSVALVFVLIGLLSIYYNYVLESRLKEVSKSEQKARSLLSSHFPDAIRRRMMENDSQGITDFCMTPAAPPKMRLKSFLGSQQSTRAVETKTVKVEDHLLFHNTKPLADLFLQCTVLFADICGFNSWSSERDPQQVFALLEAVFHEFDKVAKRKGVFKVETIGDCYVAVTGLPEPQADHAIRMTAFARSCLSRVLDVTKKLEVSLGPDTGDLRLRFGLNSGPVTAGVLRGYRSRFQLFGDTVNMASRMESTSQRNRIHLSSATADYLIAAGKSDWIQLRHDPVQVKGKGTVHTYWAVHGSADALSDRSVGTTGSSEQDLGSEIGSESGSFCDGGDLWDDDDNDHVKLALPKLSKISKTKRLVDWLVDFMLIQLKLVVAHRESTPKRTTTRKCTPWQRGETVRDEVAEVLTLTKFDVKKMGKNRVDPETVEITPEVVSQLHDYIEAISSRYRDNAFHNFEHACHVLMSVMKLLKRIVVPEDVNYGVGSAKAIASNIHDFTYGITSDPLAQFAVAFSALIHDVDHTGVSNGQLSKENPELGKKYKHLSVAEQNSVDIAWDLLMDDHYKDLQNCIFSNENELKRFRQYIVNLVMATDIFDKEMKLLRNQRWEKAFADPKDSVHTEETDSVCTGYASSVLSYEDPNLKATIVLEHIIQASDVSHTMQHWNIYKKWNERFFQEMYAAYEFGRVEKDPVEGWYKGELWFFDNYVIPLAKKLQECRVFGVSSDECLNYAQLNREEWEISGKEVVKDMVERYKKRTKLEVGGFTPDEINSFTAKELEQIINLLIKKGRAFGSMKGCDKSGQRNAAQAWLDALEIFERAPASARLKDRTIIFPIFSGLCAFLKGGKILQDEDCTFEQNLAQMFVNETDDLGDPVHNTRALAMLCEVYFRAFRIEDALTTFEEIKSVYDPQKHSAAVCKAYGTDRSVHAYSQSALWYYQLGDEKNASKACEYVLENILPFMDPKNILNSCEILWPIMRLRMMRGEDKRMRDLFNEQVVQNFYKYELKFTPCMPVFKPLLMLFDIRIDSENFENLLEAVDYLLGDKAGTFDDFLDNMYVKLGWAPNSIWAELYLRVSTKLYGEGGDIETVKALVCKGIVASRRCEWKMMKSDIQMNDCNNVDGDDNHQDHRRRSNVKTPIAYEIQEPVSTELSEFANTLGIDEDNIEKVVPGNTSNQAPLTSRFGLVRLCD